MFDVLVVLTCAVAFGTTAWLLGLAFDRISALESRLSAAERPTQPPTRQGPPVMRTMRVVAPVASVPVMYDEAEREARTGRTLMAHAPQGVGGMGPDGRVS